MSKASYNSGRNSNGYVKYEMADPEQLIPVIFKTIKLGCSDN
jgi:hypothetical protein